MAPYHCQPICSVWIASSYDDSTQFLCCTTVSILVHCSAASQLSLCGVRQDQPVGVRAVGICGDFCGNLSRGNRPALGEPLCPRQMGRFWGFLEYHWMMCSEYQRGAPPQPRSFQRDSGLEPPVRFKKQRVGIKDAAFGYAVGHSSSISHAGPVLRSRHHPACPDLIIPAVWCEN